MSSSDQDFESYLAFRLNGSAPQYEESDEALRLLRRAIEQDRTFVAGLTALEQMHVQLLSVYQSEVPDLQACLKSQRVDLKKLPKASQAHLQALVDIAELLELNHISSTSFKSALAHLDLDSYNIEKEISAKKKAETRLKDDERVFFQERDRLSKTVEELSRDHMQKKHMTVEYESAIEGMMEEAREYDERSRQIEEPPDEIRIEAIEALTADVKHLERELISLQEEYKVFENAPPDRLLVALQLEEVQAQLSSLKREREELILDMARNLT